MVEGCAKLFNDGLKNIVYYKLFVAYVTNYYDLLKLSHSYRGVHYKDFITFNVF